MSKIYLISGRKQEWPIDVPDGWEEVYFYRNDFIDEIELEKPDDQLTDEDKELVKWYGHIPEGWA